MVSTMPNIKLYATSNNKLDHNDNTNRSKLPKYIFKALSSSREGGQFAKLLVFTGYLFLMVLDNGESYSFKDRPGTVKILPPAVLKNTLVM